MATTMWQKSTYSGVGNCVEVAEVSSDLSDYVLIRESEQPGVQVATSKANLKAFFDGVKAGEFDHLVG